jgi:hypothetical protein
VERLFSTSREYGRADQGGFEWTVGNEVTVRRNASSLRNIQPSKLARLKQRERSLDEAHACDDPAELVCGKQKNGDATASEILLVSQTLIRRDEEIELCFSEAQQFAVLDTVPTATLHRLAIMPGQVLCQGPRDAFIEPDRHGAAGESRADSDRSNKRQAISRVTVGKHSRYSSRA